MLVTCYFVTIMYIVEATGQQLDALEDGVSTYPKLEGRFPQVMTCYVNNVLLCYMWGHCGSHWAAATARAGEWSQHVPKATGRFPQVLTC
jgi:hypothetical protein